MRNLKRPRETLTDYGQPSALHLNVRKVKLHAPAGGDVEFWFDEIHQLIVDGEPFANSGLSAAAQDAADRAAASATAAQTSETNINATVADAIADATQQAGDSASQAADSAAQALLSEQNAAGYADTTGADKAAAVAAADAAQTSADNAADSATQAANSAAAAAQSAVDAAQSASNAASDASAAQTSADSSAASASSAQGSADSASASATAAAGSAGEAAGYEAGAQDAADDALVSKNAAASSATTASTNATNSSTNAASALASANAANASKNAAAASAQAAADSAAEAAAIVDIGLASVGVPGLVAPDGVTTFVDAAGTITINSDAFTLEDGVTIVKNSDGKIYTPQATVDHDGATPALVLDTPDHDAAAFLIAYDNAGTLEQAWEQRENVTVGGADKLTTARTIQTVRSDGSTGTQVAFDGSQNIQLPVPPAPLADATRNGALAQLTVDQTGITPDSLVGSFLNGSARQQVLTPRASLRVGSAVTADTAAKLTTARTIRTNLASAAAPTFDGSANIAPGVSGVLPVANGGTGQTTAALARNALGLGNTTGALPIANGGTGATTAAQALTNLGLTATSADPGAGSALANGAVVLVYE